MIPAHGYIACYEADQPIYLEERVVAWNDEGCPLIVRDGGLTVAWDVRGYRGVEQVAPPTVAAVPGGGWLIEDRDDDGAIYLTPVVAWVIRADGSCFPIRPCADGSCETIDGTHNGFVRLYHPDQDEETPAEPAPADRWRNVMEDVVEVVDPEWNPPRKS